MRATNYDFLVCPRRCRRKALFEKWQRDSWNRPAARLSNFEHDGRLLSFRLVEEPTAGIGFVIWDAARILCRYLEFRELSPLPIEFRGKSVLELGAGCGLVGITAAKLGARSRLTDRGRVLPLTMHNARLNADDLPEGAALEVTTLDWGQDIRDIYRRGSFDIILGADITYSEDAREKLVLTLLQLVGTETLVLLSHGRSRAAFDQWLAGISDDLVAEEVASREEVLAYQVAGHSFSEPLRADAPLGIFRLRVNGSPIPDQELSRRLHCLAGRDSC